MERVMVFGGYDFIGYHLSKYFINQGIETLLVDDSDLTPIQSERLDTIGRNALLIRNSTNSIADNIDTVFFVYKPYNNMGSSDTSFLLSELNKAVEIAKLKNAKLMCLSFIKPRNYTPTNTIYIEFEDYFRSNTLASEISYQVIYVPYVYGPYSEENCLIQKMIHSKLLSKEVKLQLDYPKYLYIDDLVTFLYKMSNEKIKDKVVYYIPDEEDQLHKLSKWFGLNNEMRKNMEELPVNSNYKMIKSTSCRSIVEGLNKTEHYLKQILTS